MIRLTHAMLLGALSATALGLQSAALEPMHDHCTITAGDTAGTLRLETGDSRCDSARNCHDSMSNMDASRFTGISLATLGTAGAHATATLAAEAGTFACTGTVTDGKLIGDFVFTPDAGFVSRMQKMGIDGLDTQKLLAYAYLDVESGWAESLKQAGVGDLNADNLIALRVFKVDPAYVHSFVAMGYKSPSADQLVSLGSQGVNAKEVAEIRALGYQPTIDQLVQIRIFKITPDFIRRMQARGLKNLTLDKLVQIRIFNLAD